MPNVSLNHSYLMANFPLPEEMKRVELVMKIRSNILRAISWRQLHRNEDL